MSESPYAINIAFGGEAQDEAFFLCRPAHRVQTSLGTRENDIPIVSCILDTTAGPNVVSKLFLPGQWGHHIRLTYYPNHGNDTEQPIHAEGTIPMYIRIGDLCVRAWFEVV